MAVEVTNSSNSSSDETLQAMSAGPLAGVQPLRQLQQVAFVLTPEAWQRLLFHTNAFLEQTIQQAVTLSQHVPDFSDPTTTLSAGVGETALHIARWHVRDALRMVWGPGVPMRFNLIDPAYNNAAACSKNDQQQLSYQPSSTGCSATPVEARWVWIDNHPANPLWPAAVVTDHLPTNDTAKEPAASSSSSSTAMATTTTSSPSQLPDASGRASGGGVAMTTTTSLDAASAVAAAAASAMAATGCAPEDGVEMSLLFRVNAPTIITGNEVCSDQETTCVPEQQHLLREFHEAFMYATVMEASDSSANCDEASGASCLSSLLQWLRDQAMSVQTLGLLVDLAQRYVALEHVSEENVLRLLDAVLSKIQTHLHHHSATTLDSILDSLLAVCWSHLSVEDNDKQTPSSSSVDCMRQWTRLTVTILMIPGDVCQTRRSDIVKQLLHRLTQSIHAVAVPRVTDRTLGSTTTTTTTTTTNTTTRPWLLECLYRIRHQPWMTNHVPPSLQLLLQQIEREVSKGSGSGSSASTSTSV